MYHRSRVFLVPIVLALPLVGACSTGGAVSGVAIAPLVPSATYEREEELELSIDLGGQDLPIGISSNAVLDAGFQVEGEGTRVTVEHQTWEARATNPLAGTETADASQLEGATVFVLDARGRPTVISIPTSAGSADQFFDGTQLAHEFFPRLPGRTPSPGDAWTDTIAFTSIGSETESRVEQVVRYTAVGDSVVDGRAFFLIRADSDDRVGQEGITQGMSFRQDMTSTTRHTYLWDREAGLLHYSRLEGDLTGTMSVEAAGMQFGVRGRATTVMRRR